MKQVERDSLETEIINNGSWTGYFAGNKVSEVQVPVIGVRICFYCLEEIDLTLEFYRRMFGAEHGGAISFYQMDKQECAADVWSGAVIDAKERMKIGA